MSTPASIRAATTDHLQMLRSIPLFNPLTLSQLETLVDNATEQTFPTGGTIIKQGEPGNCAYIILAGRVRMVEFVPDSPIEMFLGELTTGEVFGELGILRERPRSASVTSLERTSCLVISEESFIKALEGSSSMSLELLRVLAGRLYDADRLLARHAPDPLTGLPGRRAFHELYRRLTASVRRRKASVLLLSIDVMHLKGINDGFGYNVGDDVLRTVGDALLDVSRSTDVVARYGGDEFAALFIDAKADDTQVILRRVEQKLKELAATRALPLTVNCSIGCAVTQDPPDSADELLRMADMEMQVKRLSASSTPGSTSR